MTYLIVSRVFTFISFLLLISQKVFASCDCCCHPQPNPNLAQYIIAYGSLMETKSKQGTDSSSGANKPIRVDHYQRGWFARGDSTGFSTTYLGVIKDTHAHLNGTFFRLATADLIKNYDKREKYYCRISVPPSAIHPLNSDKLPNGEFWIYELKPKYFAQPSEKYPIIESYVDIFLSGCLEIQEKFHLNHFAEACIDTTTHWSPQWVNDRIYPRRPFVFEPNAIKIDTLLTKKIPGTFSQIKIEH